MKSQIVQYILAYFDRDTTNTLATQLGEEPGRVQSTLESIVRLVLRGFATKAAQGDNEAANLLSLAATARDNSIFTRVSDWFTGSDMLDRGREILHDLFGGSNDERIAAGLATQHNIKPSSANTLMQWAAPVVLGGLGKYFGEQNMTAPGAMMSWLSQERAGFADAVVPAAATATATAAAASTVHRATTTTTHTNDKKSGGGARWLLPLLLLLGAGALMWYFMGKGCNKTEEAPTTPDTTVTTTTTTTTETTPPATAATDAMPGFSWGSDSTVAYTYSAIVTEKLPNGTELRIPGNGAEMMLLRNIRMAMEKGLDTTDAGKKSGWVNLYDVQFSKMLTYRTGATEQINNIAAILKAYPAVHIKLGGYTDNTGTAAINNKLSQDRAEMVTRDLGKQGVSAQVEKAEGYGDQFPVSDNATAEGRAQNRRVSCRIVSITK